MSGSQPAMLNHLSAEPAEKATGRTRSHSLGTMLRSNWFVGGLVGCVALGLGLYRIGEPSLWYDEMLSVERASLSLPVLWRVVNASQPNMAFYYFLLHFWLQLTSLLGLTPTEAVVRFPSALFAAGATVVLFLLARRLAGLLIGLTGAALYMFNTVQLVYTQDTRAYALQLFFLLLSWYALFVILTSEKPGRGWFIGYVVTMTLAVYTHYFSLLVFFAQGVALVCLLLLPTSWRTQTRRLFRPLLLSFFVTLVLIGPMLYASRVGSQTGWIPLPTPRDVINLFRLFANNSWKYFYAVVILALAGLVIGVLASFSAGRRLLVRCFFLQQEEDQRVKSYQLLVPFVLILLIWLLVPIVISYIITHASASIHLFLSRYLVATLPAFSLLALPGLLALPRRWLRAVVALGLVALALIFVPQYYAHAQVEEWNTGAFWVEQHYQPGDGLVCFDDLNGCQVGMEYYFQAYPTQAHFDADSPGSFPYVQYDLYRPAYQPDTTQAVNPVALQKYAGQHPRLFYIVAHLSTQAKVTQAAAAVTWLNTHYRLIDSIKAGTVTVYLYDTRSTGVSFCTLLGWLW